MLTTATYESSLATLPVPLATHALASEAFAMLLAALKEMSEDLRGLATGELDQIETAEIDVQ